MAITATCGAFLMDLVENSPAPMKGYLTGAAIIGVLLTAYAVFRWATPRFLFLLLL